MIHYKVIDRVGDKVFIQEINSSVVEECIVLENIGNDGVTLYDSRGNILATGEEMILNSMLNKGFEFDVKCVVPHK